MKRTTGIFIAVACALGMGAALAQSVQRGDATAGDAGKATPTLAQASTTAPIQTAQAGGASSGASTTGATAGMSTGTMVAIGAAVAVVAISANSSSTVRH